MADKPYDSIPDREVTDEKVYLNRRTFMKAGILAGSTLATAWAYRKLTYNKVVAVSSQPLANLAATTQPEVIAPLGPDDKINSYKDITHYNNFYEFSTEKAAVAEAAQDFVTRPWTVTVSGLVNKPKEYDLDDLLNISPPEERIYRMRCVEGWSMVIPWDGFSLSKLLNRVEPRGSAKYVAFETLVDARRMPNQADNSVLNWPYVEGLRMDEAMNPLAILVSGLYGKQLPPQDGAPIRLVTPWKYGFKGIKSIVKITLTEKQPTTTWSMAAPDEYGFYANVNPNVDHPRWSQATERRLPDFAQRPTLMFNGYADQVAGMYAGMDLRANF